MSFIRPLLQIKKSQQTFRLISSAFSNKMTFAISSDRELFYNQPKNVKKFYTRSFSGSKLTSSGTNFFNELVEESTVFVDKSLLIRDFLESWAQVILITCPRRWGKSINLTMIETFLSIQVDENGNKYLDKTKNSNYKLFRGIALKKPLKISQCADILKNYQGEYPVILIDFKDVIGENFQGILDGIKASFSEGFQKHSYLLKSAVLTEFEKELFKRYMDEYESLDLIDIKTGIRFLSRILETHFNKKVFILIDEYDAPVRSFLKSKEFSEKDMKKGLGLFEAIMGYALKGNRHLKKGLVTGVLRMQNPDIISGFNNLDYYNFLNEWFSKYYGFTENEVEELFEAHNIDKVDRLKAKDWYNGYRVLRKKASEEKDLLLYNPWSIINFLSRRVIANYWVQSGNVAFIEDLFEKSPLKNVIESLLIAEKTDDVTEIDLEDINFSLDDFIELRGLLDKGDKYKIGADSIDLFLRFIFASGCLTITEEQREGSLTSIRIPNKEVESIFVDDEKDFN